MRTLVLGTLLGSNLLLLAQQPLGATFRVDASVAARGAFLSAPGSLIARFDHDDYVGWGRTTPIANRRAVLGVTFRSEDADGSTPESWSVNLYTEDTVSAGFPDVRTALASVGPFTNPTRPAGVAAFTHTLTFATPALVPADRDVFVGVALSAANLWPADGHAVQCVLGHPSRWPQYDQTGPAPIQNQGYGLAQNAQGFLFYNTTRQLLIDLLCAAPGSACTAITNQPNYPISNAAPGTGSYLSGLHPDAANPPMNTGRADDIGFVFLANNLPNGTPVAFLTDVGNFGPEFPLSLFVPGSVGVFCLNQATVVTSVIGFLSAGQASHVIQIPAAFRPRLGNLDLLQQALALDPIGNTLHAGPCGRRTL